MYSRGKSRSTNSHGWLNMTDSVPQHSPDYRFAIRTFPASTSDKDPKYSLPFNSGLVDYVQYRHTRLNKTFISWDLE